jgi:hypothetical protein
MNRGLSTTTPGTTGLAWTIRHLEGTARAAVLLAVACLGTVNLVYGQSNPGDPLFCQPQEGVAYLIVNGGSGVFTSNSDCYGNNIANDTDTTIATSQGGTMTKTAGTGNYTYTPPTPGFTGLDTFPIHVTTVYNSAGGTGSAGGSSSPGGPATLTITLNVIPATTTLAAAGATLVPIPAGSVSGCSAPGNAGQGPVAGAVYGCVTGLIQVGANPAHGSLSITGHTLTYTPTPGFSGSDSFTYEAQGVNNDGTYYLNSGPVTVQVTVTAAPTVPTLGAWGLFILMGALLLFGMRAAKRQMV